MNDEKEMIYFSEWIPMEETNNDKRRENSQA